MASPAAAPAVGVRAWLDEPRGVGQVLEVVGGVLVPRRVGGNPHHYLARRLAEEFETQWPGTTATAPGNWALALDPAGDVLLGRVPDVLVDGDAVLREAVFTGVPDAVAEVWSPGNTLEEMNDKRRDYRATGLRVLLEVFLTDTGDVHLEWLVNAGGRWESAAAAIGEAGLTVVGPRPFSVVPNALLHRPT